MSQENEEWVSTKGSGNTWNPKADADKIPYAPENKPYEETNVERSTLIGHLIDRRDGVGQHNSSVITVITADGTKFDVWLDTVLEKELESVPMNAKVKLRWLGTKLKKNMKPGQKGATFNTWEVMYNPKDMYAGSEAKQGTDKPVEEKKSADRSGPLTKDPVSTPVSGDDDLPF